MRAASALAVAARSKALIVTRSNDSRRFALRELFARTEEEAAADFGGSIRRAHTTALGSRSSTPFRRGLEPTQSCTPGYVCVACCVKSSNACACITRLNPWSFPGLSPAAVLLPSSALPLAEDEVGEPSTDTSSLKESKSNSPSGSAQ